MKSEDCHRILGRPAFHAILVALFGGVFVWPFFVIEKPATTFILLHVAWVACAVVLFAVSRGEDPKDDEDASATADQEPR